MSRAPSSECGLAATCCWRLRRWTTNGQSPPLTSRLDALRNKTAYATAIPESREEAFHFDPFEGSASTWKRQEIRAFPMVPLRAVRNRRRARRYHQATGQRIEPPRCHRLTAYDPRPPPQAAHGPARGPAHARNPNRFVGGFFDTYLRGIDNGFPAEQFAAYPGDVVPHDVSGVRDWWLPKTSHERAALEQRLEEAPIRALAIAWVANGTGGRSYVSTYG